MVVVIAVLGGVVVAIDCPVFRSKSNRHTEERKSTHLSISQPDDVGQVVNKKRQRQWRQLQHDAHDGRGEVKRVVMV